MKLDKNWLIYWFYIKFRLESNIYFKKYFQNQNLFSIYNKAKYFLSLAIQHFLNNISKSSLETLKRYSSIISFYNLFFSFMISNMPSDLILFKWNSNQI